MTHTRYHPATEKEFTVEQARRELALLRAEMAPLREKMRVLNSILKEATAQQEAHVHGPERGHDHVPAHVHGPHCGPDCDHDHHHAPIEYKSMPPEALTSDPVSEIEPVKMRRVRIKVKRPRLYPGETVVIPEPEPGQKVCDHCKRPFAIPQYKTVPAEPKKPKIDKPEARPESESEPMRPKKAAAYHAVRCPKCGRTIREQIYAIYNAVGKVRVEELGKQIEAGNYTSPEAKEAAARVTYSSRCLNAFLAVVKRERKGQKIFSDGKDRFIEYDFQELPAGYDPFFPPPIAGEPLRPRKKAPKPPPPPLTSARNKFNIEQDFADAGLPLGPNSYKFLKGYVPPKNPGSDPPPDPEPPKGGGPPRKPGADPPANFYWPRIIRL